jgi:hypothetical protein
MAGRAAQVGGKLQHQAAVEQQRAAVPRLQQQSIRRQGPPRRAQHAGQAHLITEFQPIRVQAAALQIHLERCLHGPAGAAEPAFILIQAQLAAIACSSKPRASSSGAVKLARPTACGSRSQPSSR